MTKPIRTFEELECWRACRKLRRFIALKVARDLPEEERFRMRDQLLRAARSTTANLAEGYGRFHYLDKAKFCSHSRGSCQEVLDHLIAGVDEGLIDEARLEEGRALIADAVQLINGYWAYLKRAATSSDRVREDHASYDVDDSPSLPTTE